MTEYLGWAATAVFVGSYLCTRAAALKRVQMLGVLMWVVYGLLIQAAPVVAANLLVFRGGGRRARARECSYAAGLAALAFLNEEMLFVFFVSS